jgi:hypothetical protein
MNNENPEHGSGGMGRDNQEPIGLFGDQEKGAETVCGGRAINAGGWKSYSVTVRVLNVKMIEVARANFEAAFDFALQICDCEFAVGYQQAVDDTRP